MRLFLWILGFVFVVQGLAGIADHLWHDSNLGIVSASFRRYVIENIAVLQEHAPAAYLGLVAIGVVLIVAQKAVPSSGNRTGE